MASRTRRSHVALALGILLVTAVGCFACNAVDRVGSKLLGRLPSASPRTTAPPVDEPPVVPTADPALRIGSLAEIPSEPGHAFEMLVSEEQINDKIRDIQMDREGFTASEPRLTLAEEAILGTVNVTQPDTGLSVAISFRGQPRVVDGEVFFAVKDVTLGDSVRGMTRLLAQGMIDQVLRQMNAEQGIALPLDTPEDVEILAVAVEPGVLRVTGRTR
ncbi:MAG: hypothetical protein GX657_02395 [Chloroflexi bacterium]|nr:hypothetical protein [Chloroflexota bacterium]